MFTNCVQLSFSTTIFHADCFSYVWLLSDTAVVHVHMYPSTRLGHESNVANHTGHSDVELSTVFIFTLAATTW